MHSHSPRILVSIGTGTAPEDPEANKPPEKVTVIQSWKNMLKLMVHLATQSEETAAQVEDACSEANPPVKYYRWTVPGVIRRIKLDEWVSPVGGNTTKGKIFDATLEYLSQRKVHKTLLECARKLVRARRHRLTTERWEEFARRMVHYCPEPICHVRKVSKTFFTRDELRERGVNEHFYIGNLRVQNEDRYHHTCLFDRCRHDGVFIFEKEQESQAHLKDSHGVESPQFFTMREMESWLDEGRRRKTC